MKPFGREGKIKGSGSWKRDYHIHDKNHRKVLNWWEGEMEHFLSRSRMKQIWKNIINKDK